MNQHELDIITSALRGERAGQRKLYDSLSPWVLGICARYSRDRTEAHDMAQEAWIKVFAKLSSYSMKGNFRGWVGRITTNTCIDILRKRQLDIDDDYHRRLETNESNIPKQLTTCSNAVSNMTTEDLLKLVQRLPERFRLVFNMVAVEGYTHQEVAEKLGITTSTSRSQLSRARVNLQEQFKKLFALCV